MSVDRPQYGEYASPEEQRVRAGLPPMESAPSASETTVSARLTDATAQSPHPRVGRMVTIVLLGIGLVYVVSSIPGFLDLSAALKESMRTMGVEGTFSNFAAAKAWGAIALIVMLVGYALTVWLSWRRIRHNRLSWWIPLVGCVVTMIIVTVCISVPLMGDPAFIQSVLTPSPG